MSHQESKYDAYRKAEEGKDSMQLLNDRLTEDLRMAVRRLGLFPVFSTPWVNMVSSLSRMAVVSDMEGNLPQQNKDATIWETQENFVRFIVEDGKLNVIMRAMIEYKKYRLASMNTPDEIEINERISLCNDFENSLGKVLYHCWSHVEVVQTTELLPLVEYIAATLRDALSTEEALAKLIADPMLAQKQEVMCLLYVGRVLQHIEALREERIMPLLRKAEVFPKMVVFLLRVHSYLPQNVVKLSINALSMWVETEDYSTYTSAYLGTDSSASLTAVDTLHELLELRTQIAAPLLKSLPRDQRMQVKPLVDAIDKYERLSRK